MNMPLNPFPTSSEGEAPLPGTLEEAIARLKATFNSQSTPQFHPKKGGKGKPAIRGDGKGGTMADPASLANDARIQGQYNPLSAAPLMGPLSSQEKDAADAAEHRLRKVQAELAQKKLVKDHQNSLREDRLSREKANPQKPLPKVGPGQINVDGKWLPGGGDQAIDAARQYNAAHPWSPPTQGGPAPLNSQQFQDQYQLRQRTQNPGAMAPHEMASTNPQDAQFQRALSARRVGIPTDAPRTPDEILIYQMLMGQ